MFALLILVVDLLAIAGFFYSYQQNKSRLINGFLLNCIILVTGLLFGTIVIQINYQPFTVFSLIIAGIILLFALFISTFYGLFLLWNGFIVWKRESHSLANTLTLILGVLSLIYPFVFGLIKSILPYNLFVFLDNIFTVLLFYIVFCFFNFLSSLLLFYFYRPRRNKDFIIVLGSGLINGNQVPPLLAARINRAIWFYHKQLERGNKPPYIICSGGQGSDESTSEGQAMRDYVVKQGINQKHVIAETKAKNTIENMSFSKKIVNELNLNPQHGIFVTSYYHLYRGAEYARLAGMNINGLGAKTKFFFVPNAIIREYIAVLLSHKKIHLIAVVTLILIAILKSIGQLI